ncbi:MAG: NAD(P)/FAD-dependent oxidoreductase [Desulfurococcaceae archaeon]
MKKDVVVIGGGPAGLYTALHIRSRDVTLIEEHEKVGIPKHCSGVVGGFVAKEVSKLSPNLIDNYYEEIVLATPVEKIELNFKKPIAFHVNRPLLEEKLVSKVESLGHEIIYRARATPAGSRYVKINKELIEFNTLIVAEGANSVFRRILIGNKTRYLYGLQLVIKARNIMEKTLAVIYSDLNPDFFAWIIPLNDEEVQVGYASTRLREDILCKLIAKYVKIDLLRVIDKYGGLIPIHKPLKNPILNGNIVFHGDTVPLIKPYTGGGLYYIFKLSPLLGKYVDINMLNSYVYEYLRSFYVKTFFEHTLVELFRKTRYYLPVSLVNRINKLNMLLEEDYDEHYKIVLKSLVFTPIMPFLLFS